MIGRFGMCTVNVTEFDLRQLSTNVILRAEHNIFEHLCILSLKSKIWYEPRIESTGSIVHMVDLARLSHTVMHTQ